MLFIPDQCSIDAHRALGKNARQIQNCTEWQRSSVAKNPLLKVLRNDRGPLSNDNLKHL